MESFHDARATPNDPKLSDGGGWRAGCTVGGKAAAEAASVTAGAVRCSAWLGVAGIWLGVAGIWLGVAVIRPLLRPFVGCRGKAKNEPPCPRKRGESAPMLRL